MHFLCFIEVASYPIDVAEIAIVVGDAFEVFEPFADFECLLVCPLGIIESTTDFVDLAKIDTVAGHFFEASELPVDSDCLVEHFLSLREVASRSKDHTKIRILDCCFIRFSKLFVDFDCFSVHPLGFTQFAAYLMNCARLPHWTAIPSSRPCLSLILSAHLSIFSASSILSRFRIDHAEVTEDICFPTCAFFDEHQ